MSKRMICSKVLIGELYIFISSVIFAFTIIASRQATRNMAGPTTFKAWTHIFSTLLLFILRYPLKSALDSNIGDNKEPEHIEILVSIKKRLSFISEYTFDLFFWGTISGLANFGIAIFFQYGLLTVEAGKAAFINSLFVVATPFIASFIPGASHKITLTTWFCVALSVIGTYCLSNPMSSSSSFGVGEMYMLGSMLSCAFNIIASDLGSKRVDCIDLTMVEFVVAAVLCAFSSLLMEAHMWYWPFPALQDGISLIVLVGLLESMGYLISTVGQTYSSSARAALIYSLESVNTVLLGYIILKEALTKMEIIGCTLVFMATLISSSVEAADEVPMEVLEDVECIPILQDVNSDESRRLTL